MGSFFAKRAPRHLHQDLAKEVSEAAVSNVPGKGNDEQPSRAPARMRLQAWLRTQLLTVSWDATRTQQIADRLLALGFALVFVMLLYIFLVAG
jgi:hypothetical protein